MVLVASTGYLANLGHKALLIFLLFLLLVFFASTLIFGVDVFGYLLAENAGVARRNALRATKNLCDL